VFKIYSLIRDLQFNFKVEADHAKIAKEKQYDKKCLSIFKELCQKYDNLSDIDALSNAQSKVDDVKIQVQENITLALQNTEKLEEIASDAGKYHNICALLYLFSYFRIPQWLCRTTLIRV
jgi:hypothetical protein